MNYWQNATLVFVELLSVLYKVWTLQKIQHKLKKFLGVYKSIKLYIIILIIY